MKPRIFQPYLIFRQLAAKALKKATQIPVWSQYHTEAWEEQLGSEDEGAGGTADGCDSWPGTVDQRVGQAKVRWKPGQPLMRLAPKMSARIRHALI